MACGAVVGSIAGDWAGSKLIQNLGYVADAAERLNFTTFAEWLKVWLPRLVTPLVTPSEGLVTRLQPLITRLVTRLIASPRQPFEVRNPPVT